MKKGKNSIQEGSFDSKSNNSSKTDLPDHVPRRAKNSKSRNTSSSLFDKQNEFSENSVGLGEFAKQIGLDWEEGQPDVIALQETKCNMVDRNWVNMLWGSDGFDFIQKGKIGNSGGSLLVSDTNEFSAKQAFIEEFYIAVRGKWKGRVETSYIVNIYVPHNDTNKLKMWASLEIFLGVIDAAWILCGDFNEVRNESERKNCEFNERGAEWFNDFINHSNLIEVPMGGKRFTRICDNGIKFNKLDRFLISEKVSIMWNELLVLALDQKLSEHYPIVLRDRSIDFGPKPTKIFDKWLDVEGSDVIITNAWNKEVQGHRLDCKFRDKNEKY
ncbi:uncharacterized protein [Rutidosis leptorrhynchoides]|uniref:uncharacterized protein n=1 Tax=Rutidosis leptorrhynchoides TaxID=125765 RepID=UPI003A99C268